MAENDSNSSETVTVKYERHSQVLIEGLWNFLATKYRVDDVVWSGGRLKAHQLILDVFLPQERLLGSVTMSSDLPLHFDSLLEFLYRGSVDVKKDKLGGLLQLAKEMDFQMLVDAVVAASKNHCPRTANTRCKPAKKRPWEPAIEIVSEGEDAKGTVRAKRTSSRIAKLKIQKLAIQQAAKKTKTALLPRFRCPNKRPLPRRPSIVRPASKCTDCEFESTNVNVLKSHQAVVHTKERSLKCTQCVFMTCWTGVLQHHAVVSHGTKIKRFVSKACKRLSKKRATRIMKQTSAHRLSAPSKRSPPAKPNDGNHAQDKPFKCSHCDKRFHQRMNLTRHVTSQHKEVPGGFTCKVCSTVFKTRAEIFKHRRVHSQEKRFQCPHCQKRFTSMSCIREHVQRVHTEGPAGFACEVCERRFKTQAGLREHRKIHAPERPFLCQHCGKGFNQSSGLKSHVRNRHVPVAVTGRFVCDTCGKSMNSRSKMAEHQRVHTQETPFKCMHCERSFRTSSQRKLHIVNAHTEGPGAFECEVCGKRSKTRQNMKNHQRVHTQEKPYKCPQCEKCFISWSHRNNHVKSAHAQVRQTFPCETCGRLLKTRSGLIEHRRTHTQERPFKCPHCDRRFNQSTQRGKHVKKMHGQGGQEVKETHVCETCGKQVSSHRALYEHRQTHNPDKILKCPHCDYTTTNAKNYLSTHLDVVHGIGPGLFTCETCGRRCASEKMLARHNLSHTKEKPFKCDQCPYAASMKWSLKGHVDAVHGPGRFRCEVCDKVLRSANQLVMHRRIHTQEKPFACPHCDHRSSRKHNLDSHIEVVHGQGSKKCICPTCGESLKSASQLAHHRRTHAKERKARDKLKPAPSGPERCSHCSHTSADRASLDEHVRSVHGPAQFACDVCGERRSSMEDLAEHRRSHSSAYPFDLFRFQSMHHL